MFWWEEGFEVSVDDAGDLVSRGKCPVYKYYPWAVQRGLPDIRIEDS